MVVTVLCWSGLLTVVTGCIEVCSYTFVFVTIFFLTKVVIQWLLFCMCRLAGDQRARRDSRHDSDAEDDDDVKKVQARPLVMWCVRVNPWF